MYAQARIQNAILKRRIWSAKTKKKAISLKSILARNTDEFCKNTTLHGLKYVTSDELYAPERIFFAISIVVVLIISGYLIFNVYSKWSRTPVILGIKPEPTFIANEPFPAVTVCNLNQALKDEALKFPQNSTEYAMLQLMCKTKVNSTLVNSITDWKRMDKFVMKISQPCHNMVISCRFGAQEYNCSELFYPILTDEGLCCVFNMLHPKFMYVSYMPVTFRNIVKNNDYEAIDWYAEKGYPTNVPKHFFPRRTPGTGESLGLSITLNVEHDKYYCSSSNSVGFKISLHSPNESPNVRETGILISPGKESKLRIRPEKTETDHHLRSIHKNLRHCLFHNEGQLKYFAHYTQRNCEMECVAEMLMKYCGCISFYMPKIYENATICSIHMTNCVEMVRLQTDPRVKTCFDYCMPSCYDLSFWSDVFVTQISNDGFKIANEKLQNLSFRYVIRNIAVVNMYFKEYSFRSNIQTEFIGLTEFLSGIGGILGLFVGFSFISIAELLYFAIIRPIRNYFLHKNCKITAVSTERRRMCKGMPNRTMKRIVIRPYSGIVKCPNAFCAKPTLDNVLPVYEDSYINTQRLKTISNTLDNSFNTRIEVPAAPK